MGKLKPRNTTLKIKRGWPSRKKAINAIHSGITWPEIAEAGLTAIEQRLGIKESPKATE
jgi:hypothetical protein